MTRTFDFTVGPLFGGYLRLYRSELSTGGYRLHLDAEITRWKGK